MTKDNNESAQNIKINLDLKTISKKSNIDSSSKKETKNNERKINPKKFDIEKYLKTMNENNNIKYNNIPKETKKIKIFNIKEKINQMNKKNELLNKIQEEVLKPIPKKKFNDNYFQNFQNQKKETKVIETKTLKKINIKERLNKIIEYNNSKNFNIIEEDSFFDLNIKNRDNNKFSETVNLINKLEEERKQFEELKKNKEINRAKRIQEMKKRKEERKILEEEKRKNAKKELKTKREKEEEEEKKEQKKIEKELKDN